MKKREGCILILKFLGEEKQWAEDAIDREVNEELIRELCERLIKRLNESKE